MLKKNWLVFYCYGAVLCLYTVWSYALTAPNLILTSWSPYVTFQNYMWQTLFNNRPLLSYAYGTLIFLLFLIYGVVSYLIYRKNVKFKLVLIAAVVILPLLFANNALSYDVFNYIFNAKMVSVYHANPHIKVALDYASDNWIRFMHNTHTPAPYGYGWTLLSLIPFSLGMGKFLPTWIIFRLFSALSLVWLSVTYFWIQRKKKALINSRSMLIVLLNPLLLIEVVTNSHNDLWMMVPALSALALLLQKNNKPKLTTLLLSIALLSFSISIKFATVLLIPIWLWILLQRRLPKLEKLINYWPLFSSLLMFLPLLTARSQQFHPWYLIWVLIWLPLFGSGKSKWLNTIQQTWFWSVIVLSASSMLRYLPYLWNGEHSDLVLNQQKLFTWMPFVGIFFILLFRFYQSSRVSSNELQ